MMVGRKEGKKKKRGQERKKEEGKAGVWLRWQNAYCTGDQSFSTSLWGSFPVYNYDTFGDV